MLNCVNMPQQTFLKHLRMVMASILQLILDRRVIFPAVNRLYFGFFYEITYSLSNLNGATVEIWEWITKFIPRFIMDVITYPYQGYC